MATIDPRVDAYIERAAEFARPILRHLREVVHEGAPRARETIKWGFPNFTQRGILCSMAAFKAHCALGFWKAELVLPERQRRDTEGMGQFGRITSVSDLPPRPVLIGYIRTAVELNEAGVKVPASPKGERSGAMPEPFRVALAGNPAAAAAFERFSPSGRRAYVEWIAEAKREETRARRIATALEWISEGKPRNWKYTGK